MYNRFHNQFYDKFKAQKYSSASYREQMQKTFQDNAHCIKYFIEYSLEGNENVGEIEERMMATQKQIGHWIGYFDHDKTNITKSVVTFIEPIKQAGLVYQYKINEKKFKTHWFERADTLMKLLNLLSDWDIRPFFYKQIMLIEALIKSGLQKNTEAITYYYGLLIENNSKLSLQLSDGIIRQYKHKFA